MFLHEFREDFVLALELLLQERRSSDPWRRWRVGCGARGRRRRSRRTPSASGRTSWGGCRAGHTGPRRGCVRGDGAEGWRPSPGRWSRFRVFLGMGEPPLESCSLFEQTVCPISTEAKQDGSSKVSEALLKQIWLETEFGKAGMLAIGVIALCHLPGNHMPPWAIEDAGGVSAIILLISLVNTKLVGANLHNDVVRLQNFEEYERKVLKYMKEDTGSA